MARSVRSALVLLALAAAPALAQGAPRAEVDDDFTPLLEVRSAPRPRPPLRERAQGLLTRALRAVPGLATLAPPTTGRVRVAVVLAAFSDTGVPPFAPAEWEQALFSRGTYRQTAGGARTWGSLADWYAENSSGQLAVEGRVFPWVSLRAKRADVEPRPLIDPAARRDVFAAALDALLAREGPRALDGFDALAFVVSGGWAGQRGSILWPHSSVLLHRGRPWRYYLMHAGAQRFEDIGVHCHEFGHVLGLLDEYGVGGEHTGLGQWCAMASGAHGGRDGGVERDAPPRTFEDTAREVLDEQLEQAREWMKKLGLGGGQAPPPGPGQGPARPLHLCAVCKERLGWTRPIIIDPRTTRRIALSPIEGDVRQVARVLLDPQGREQLALEYRAATGFDQDLPRSGLLVWRTGDPLAVTRTFMLEAQELIPAHGVASTDAPQRAVREVPFPTPERREVVVRGSRGGAFAVRLSRIEERDGRLLVEVSLAPRDGR